MSLINEALKRARVEAARRDAAEKGVPAAALPLYLPHSRRPWLAPIVGFLAGLAAVGLAAGAFWLARRPISPEGARSAQVAGADGTAEVSAPISDAPAPAPAQVLRPAADPRVDRHPAPGHPAPGPPVPSLPRSGAETRHSGTSIGGADEASDPRSPAADPPAVDPPAPPTAAIEQPPVAPPPSTGGDATGRTYFREAAPAGTRVKVDFIVWSESRPFAQINGQLLSSGQTIDGYTLLEVERERVELEGDGARFWIRVR